MPTGIRMDKKRSQDEAAWNVIERRGDCGLPVGLLAVCLCVHVADMASLGMLSYVLKFRVEPRGRWPSRKKLRWLCVVFVLSSRPCLLAGVGLIWEAVSERGLQQCRVSLCHIYTGWGSYCSANMSALQDTEDCKKVMGYSVGTLLIIFHTNLSTPGPDYTILILQYDTMLLRLCVAIWHYFWVYPMLLF